MPKGRRAKPGSTDPNRMPNGKFAPGNNANPNGNPQLRRLAEYQHIVRETVTPSRLQRVLLRLLKLAEGGDMLAAKVLLDRALGKATAAPKLGEVLAVELPTLATTGDTVKASNAILRALSEGRLSPDDGAKLASIVELARRTIETHDLSERLAALEREREL